MITSYGRMISMHLRSIAFVLMCLLGCFAPDYVHAQYAVPRTMPAALQPQKNIRILAFGDSLTAGYGLSPHEAYPAVLQKTLRNDGYKIEIYNAGKSGDTTASGLKRIHDTLQRYPDPDLVIFALGANDLLRRVQIQETEKNLTALMELFKSRNIPVFMVGIKAYVHPSPIFKFKFNRLFPRIADEYAAGFMPDFLEGVAMNAAMNIEDGIHPNTRGVALMVDNTIPYLTPVLDTLKKQTEKKPSN